MLYQAQRRSRLVMWNDVERQIAIHRREGWRAIAALQFSNGIVMLDFHREADQA